MSFTGRFAFRGASFWLISLVGLAAGTLAAAGEGLQLGRVMGPRFGELMPVAVTNPIFVDVDGNGFQASGDLLDLPLPNAGKPLGGKPKSDKQGR